MRSKSRLVLALAVVLAISACAGKTESITPEEARAIAKEAYIYASPMVDGALTSQLWANSFSCFQMS